jgi:hypothetical protein
MLVAAQPEAQWLDVKHDFKYDPPDLDPSREGRRRLNAEGVDVIQGGWTGPGALSEPLYTMGIKAPPPPLPPPPQPPCLARGQFRRKQREVRDSDAPGRTYQGKDQIVGVADSGLDRSHCVFTEDVPIGVTQPFANINSATNDWTSGMNTDHRKVISYYAHAGAGVDPGGRDHGTHVCGSVAGDSEEGSKYAGAAPEAQLSFFDIGPTPSTGGLDVPNNLQTTVFRHSYDTGARIHSNSWGSNTPTYTSFARDIDAFMADNDDFLVRGPACLAI